MRWKLTNKGKVFFSALAIVILTVILVIVIFSSNKTSRTVTVQRCDNVEAYVYRQDRAYGVSPGFRILSGDRIEVKNGSGWVTLVSENGIYTTLFVGTGATVSFTGQDASGTMNVAVDSGAVMANIATGLGGGSYTVTTGSSTVSGDSNSAFLVEVEAKTDYQETRLHALQSGSILKVLASKVNAEENLSVPQNTFVRISHTDTTGKNRIESSETNNIGNLTGAYAAVIAEMQAANYLRTDFSQDELNALAASIATPTPPAASALPPLDTTDPLSTLQPTTDVTDPMSTADPNSTAEPVGTKTVIEAGDPNCQHDYQKDTRQSREATCTTGGVEYYKCSKCSASYLINTPKNDSHTFGAGVHTAGADCTTKGYTTYTCTVCGETKKVEDENAPGHAYDSGRRTDGDCQHYGSTTYTCTKCGATKTVQDTEYGAHRYENVHTAGSCIDKGYTTPVCSVCGAKDTDHIVIDAEYGSHSYGEDHRCKYCNAYEPGYEPSPTETSGNSGN